MDIKVDKREGLAQPLPTTFETEADRIYEQLSEGPPCYQRECPEQLLGVPRLETWQSDELEWLVREASWHLRRMANRHDRERIDYSAFHNPDEPAEQRRAREEWLGLNNGK